MGNLGNVASGVTAPSAIDDGKATTISVSHNSMRICALCSTVIVSSLFAIGCGERRPIVQDGPATKSVDTPRTIVIRHEYRDGGRIIASLDGAASEVVVLESHPGSLEPELRQGRWLLVVYGVNNANHIWVAHQSADIAQRLRNRCRVAIRPTVAYESLPDWLPDFTDDIEYSGRPLWLWLDEGKLVASDFCSLTVDEGVAATEKVFAARVE